ncbi:hypothetical protein TRVL_03626 [Trypanosoma vivax]|nr:hypothetical protein TRVL_03626 [Trypanosoma vivax]
MHEGTDGVPHGLRKQYQELRDAISTQEQLVRERSQIVQSISSSVAEAENSLEESREGLKTTEALLEEAILNNRVARTERRRIQEEEVHDRLEHDEYVRELSETDVALNETESQIESLVNMIESVSKAPGDVATLRRVTLVRLVAMLDDLYESLRNSLGRVHQDEDDRAKEVLKAIRELSRERERAYGYCVRKKREITSMIELKQRRTNELLLESKKNIAVLHESQEKATLSIVGKIQVERDMLHAELEEIKNANQKLADLIRKREEADGALPDRARGAEGALLVCPTQNESCTTLAAQERARLREQLRALDDKRNELGRAADELRERMNSEMEKNTATLRELKLRVRMRKQEASKLENENRKLKALCDSMASALEVV